MGGVHPAVHRMRAMIATMELPVNTVAYTVLSGRNDGGFNNGAVRPIGTACHIVLQIMPDGQRPILRTYQMGVAKFAHEPIIGGPMFNTTVYDLSDPTRGQPFPAQNSALADAVVRMLQHLASGDHKKRANVRFPELMAVLYGGVERALTPRRTQAFLGYCRDMRNLKITAPFDARIVNARVLDAPHDDFMYLSMLVGDPADGNVQEMLLPAGADFSETIANRDYAGEDVLVRRGEVIAMLGEGVAQATLEAYCWYRAQYTVPDVSGVGDSVAVPFPFIRDCVRSGTEQLDAIWEDLSGMLGHKVPNPAQLVLNETTTGSVDEPSAEMLTKMRQRLGHNAPFATDGDLLAALRHPQAQLRLSGLAGVQSWAVRDADDLRFRAGCLLVDFLALRPQWRKLFGDMRPRQRLLQALDTNHARPTAPAGVIPRGQLPALPPVGPSRVENVDANATPVAADH